MRAGLQNRWVVGVATHINSILKGTEIQLLYTDASSYNDPIRQHKSMYVGTGYQQVPHRTLSFFNASFKMLKHASRAKWLLFKSFVQTKNNLKSDFVSKSMC